jgi:SAM-dependent methyltransferase
VLEIGPGFGRWTEFLVKSCDQLVLVDLSQQCIDACRQLFRDRSNIEFHVNDGSSLAAIEDGSLDFVFSFDSLVHASPEVLDGYLAELARKLRPGGTGFIHHSNLGNYQSYYTVAGMLPAPIRAGLTRLQLLSPDSWRDPNMTAERFAASCLQYGMTCTIQELVNWEGYTLTDCMSTFVNTPAAGTTRRIYNRGFRREAARLRKLTAAYFLTAPARTAT